MKKLITTLVIAFTLLSCSGSSSDQASSKDSSATASDTIMGTTNPGVGSVVDDTARPK